jgi:TolA-binding protein
VEIPFRGSGWVYLGELAARRGIVYDSRRLDPEGQSFIFRAETPGTYALKFYKQDFIRDFILNDYVRVLVEDGPRRSGAGGFASPLEPERVIAEPRWPSSLEEAAARRREDFSAPLSPPAAPPEKTAPPAETAVTGQASRALAADGLAAENAGPAAGLPDGGGADDASPEGLLQKAGEEFEAGRTPAAIALLDRFRERYPAGSDELYWLYGRFYEAAGPARDIRASLGYYRRLVREYPQSGRCAEARRRIAYLERYYINIQ